MSVRLRCHRAARSLKTDMQGHDFRALKSAGKLLAERVHYIMGEVWIKNGCARTQPASRRHVHGALWLSSGSLCS